MGPSSAFGGDAHATCSCNAIVHNMTTVEAEHIAYICVQVSIFSNQLSHYHDVITPGTRYILQFPQRDSGANLMANSVIVTCIEV
jgi:hypothetical protein